MQTPLCVTTFSVCECITAKESIFNLIDDCISFPPFAIRTLNPLACPLHAHVQIVNIAGALRAHWIYVRHARASRRQEHTSPSRAPTAAGFSALACVYAHVGGDLATRPLSLCWYKHNTFGTAMVRDRACLHVGLQRWGAGAVCLIIAHTRFLFGARIGLEYHAGRFVWAMPDNNRDMCRCSAHIDRITGL